MENQKYFATPPKLYNDFAIFRMFTHFYASKFSIKTYFYENKILDKYLEQSKEI